MSLLSSLFLNVLGHNVTWSPKTKHLYCIYHQLYGHFSVYTVWHEIESIAYTWEGLTDKCHGSPSASCRCGIHTAVGMWEGCERCGGGLWETGTRGTHTVVTVVCPFKITFLVQYSVHGRLVCVGLMCGLKHNRFLLLLFVLFILYADVYSSLLQFVEMSKRNVWREKCMVWVTCHM